jgi:hypothetical protein
MRKTPMAQLPLVSIDKSFAHAVSAEKLAAFGKKCVFLIPSALYYEIFDTEPRNRPRTLTGFGEFRRIHLPEMIETEKRTGKPIGDRSATVLF